MANIVKSVEFVEATLSGIATTYTVLSGTQDLDNCVPFMSSTSTSNTLGSNFTDVYFELQGAERRVHISRHGTDNVKKYGIYIVEFDPEEVKVQQGSFSMSAASVDVTISGVSLEHAAVVAYHTAVDERADRSCVATHFPNSTTLRFQTYSAGTISGHYYVFEALDEQFTVKSLNWATSNISYPLYTTPVSLSKGFLLTSWYSTYGGLVPSYSFVSNRVASKSSLRCHKYNGSYTCYIKSFYVEMNDDRYHTQHWYPTMDASAVSVEYDLHRNVDLDYSMAMVCNVQGMSAIYSTSSIYFSEMFCLAELTSASGVALSRNSGNVTCETYLQVFDWKGTEVPVGSNTNPLPPAESCVKSVERVTLDIEPDDNFVEYTLTKGQVLDNCVPFFSSRGEADNFPDNMFDLWFESPAILCVQRGGYDSTHKTTINVSVVEFYPDQVNVVSEDVVFTGTTLSTTISGVDTDKSAVLLAGFLSESANTTSADRNLVRVSLESSTSVQCYRYSSSATPWVGTFYIFEDLVGNFNVEQHTGSANYTERIVPDTELDPTASFLLGTYTSTYGGTAPSYVQTRLLYQTPHLVGLFKYNLSYTYYYSVYIIKFIDDKEHTQNVYHYFDGTTSSGTQPLHSNFIGHTESISVHSNTPIAGSVNSSSGSYLHYGWSTIRLSENNLLIEMDYGTTPGVTTGPAFSVVDWLGFSPPTGSGSYLRGKGLVKSIEHLELTISGSDYMAYKYLERGKDLSQCVPFVSYTTDTDDINVCKVFVAPLIFENPYKIVAQRGWFYDSSMGPVDLNIDVVEFNPNYIKVTRGWFQMPSSPYNITIDEVDLDRTFVLLYFYCFEVSNRFDKACLEAYFSDSTTLTIKAYGNDNNPIMGHYYIIESVDDTFSVEMLRFSYNNTEKTWFYSPMPSNVYKRMFFSTFNSDSGGIPPSYGAPCLHKELTGYRVQRYTLSYTIYQTLFMVDFNEGVGIHSQHGVQEFDASDTVVYQDINKVVSENSIVMPISPIHYTSVNSSSATYFPDMSSRLSLTASGTKIKFERPLSGVAGRVAYQTLEFPEFNKYYFDGTVTEQGLPAPGRVVRAYRKDTGYMVDETTSASGTGYFYLETTYSGTHDIVCLDDVGGYSYNDLIYGDVIPTTISGM